MISIEKLSSENRILKIKSPRIEFIFLFLEESFAALIGIIFIYEAFSKMIDINRHRPVRLHTVDTLPSNCSCTNSNGTVFRSPNTTISVIKYFFIEKKRKFRFD